MLWTILAFSLFLLAYLASCVLKYRRSSVLLLGSQVVLMFSNLASLLNRNLMHLLKEKTENKTQLAITLIYESTPQCWHVWWYVVLEKTVMLICCLKYQSHTVLPRLLFVWSTMESISSRPCSSLVKDCGWKLYW